MPNQTSENNKRIAKNTLFLYVRMFIVMAVSLFTVRIVLNALGTEDYGIYNVVGGVVTMFSFLTSTLISASQRFFSYSLGKKDNLMLSRYFSMLFWCYLGLVLIIAFLAETIGLWFVTNKLTIPSERMSAAICVFQFAILSFAANILVIPYNSIIIAREKMNIYAVVGLMEVLIKLGIVYFLYISPIDKLKMYSLLMFISSTLVSTFYIAYGVKNFSECKIRFFWNTNIFKEVLNYSGWSLFGAISGVFRSQGINILLNIFFSPVVNTARAIAFQVNNAINQFVLNFYKAVQPQITKYYAASDEMEFMKLIFRSSRYCYYLILILSLPVLFEMPFILGLWLKNVPDGAVLFTRLVIITAIIDSMAYPLQTATAATGEIKWYQIVTGGLLIMNLPISWLFLRMGYPAEITMYIAIAIALISQLSRIMFSKHLINLSIKQYFNDVFCRILLISIFSIIPIHLLKQHLEVRLSSSIIIILCSIGWTILIVYILGIPFSEKKALNKIIIGIVKQ